MAAIEQPERPGAGTESDEALVRRILAGERELFAELMRRHNRPVYRAARAIVRDEHEAEDVMQEAYVRAFSALGSFQGRSSFSTWLLRIAIHESLARARRSRRPELAAEAGEEHMGQRPFDPERVAAARELTGVVEEVLEGMPEHYRLVFVLRSVEGLSLAETAASLEIGEDTVKSRHHRARRLLQEALSERLDSAAPEAFQLHLSRCDRVVARVMARIQGEAP